MCACRLGPLFQLWVTNVGEAPAGWGSKQFGMQIRAAFLRGLGDLHRNAVGVGPGVVTDASNLPGNFHVRLIGFDDESVLGHLGVDDGLRELTHDGELIAEVAVEGFEPFGHVDDSESLRVGGYVAVVDVHHVGRFDEGVIEVLVGGIDGVIDLERAGSLGEIAVDVDVAEEEAAKPPL